MRFFLNIFRKKCMRPFWPTASLSTLCRISCALKASPIYLLKIVSCNSALLSNPLPGLTSIYVWTIVIIYNPAGLWIAVPLSSIFQLAFLELATKPQEYFRPHSGFRGQAEPLVNSSSDWQLESHLLVHTPRASLSLFPPLPIRPLHKLQIVRYRRLKVLILQVVSLFV